MVPILGAFGNCAVLEQYSNHCLSSILDFCLNIFFEKLPTAEKLIFLTKAVLESMKMDLHTSHAPFLIGINVSNLLMLSNMCFFWSDLAQSSKKFVQFFWTRLYVELKKVINETKI